MDKLITPESSPQLKKVQRASTALGVFINLTMAFFGIGMVIVLIIIAVAGRIRIDVGNGDFDIRSVAGELVAGEIDEGQLLIVPHAEPKRRGLKYEAPDVRTATLPLTAGIRVALGIVTFLNFWAMLYLLGKVANLFEHYRKGEIFTRSAVNCIHQTGRALLCLPALALFNSLFASALLASIAPELGFFDISIKPLLLWFALLVMMIAWIMDVGRALQEEQELTI